MEEPNERHTGLIAQTLTEREAALDRIENISELDVRLLELLLRSMNPRTLTDGGCSDRKFRRYTARVRGVIIACCDERVVGYLQNLMFRNDLQFTPKHRGKGHPMVRLRVCEVFIDAARNNEDITIELKTITERSVLHFGKHSPEDLLEHEVREAAVRALAKRYAPDGSEPYVSKRLATMLVEEKSVKIRRTLCRVLGERIEDAHGREALIETYENGPLWLKPDAVQALGKYQHEDAKACVRRAFRYRDPRVQHGACKAVRWWPAEEAIPLLEALRTSADRSRYIHVLSRVESTLEEFAEQTPHS